MKIKTKLLSLFIKKEKGGMIGINQTPALDKMMKKK